MTPAPPEQRHRGDNLLNWPPHIKQHQNESTYHRVVSPHTRAKGQHNKNCHEEEQGIERPCDKENTHRMHEFLRDPLDCSLRNFAMIRCATRLLPMLPTRSPARETKHNPAKAAKMPNKPSSGVWTARLTMASNAALASPLTPPAKVANKAIGQKDRRIRKRRS